MAQPQQVHEVILGRPLVKAAFRRRITSPVKETGRYAEGAGYRPALLFRVTRQLP